MTRDANHAEWCRINANPVGSPFRDCDCGGFGKKPSPRIPQPKTPPPTRGSTRAGGVVKKFKQLRRRPYNTTLNFIPRSDMTKTESRAPGVVVTTRFDRYEFPSASGWQSAPNGELSIHGVDATIHGQFSQDIDWVVAFMDLDGEEPAPTADGECCSPPERTVMAEDGFSMEGPTENIRLPEWVFNALKANADDGVVPDLYNVRALIREVEACWAELGEVTDLRRKVDLLNAMVVRAHNDRVTATAHWRERYESLADLVTHNINDESLDLLTRELQRINQGVRAARRQVA